MRSALWFLALFGIAVAVALFAGNNQGTITLFWPPYRVDLSLNMVLMLLFGGFTLLYAALRALGALRDLPRQARRWRLAQKERAMHGALLDALSQLLAGRFVRARKSALAALAQEEALAESGEPVPHGRQLRTLALLVAAESSHALQDRATREAHLAQALDNIPVDGSLPEQELREGAQLRAARWSLDERDTTTALERLAALPVGAARRTLALRAKLKASRLAHRTDDALETARLLAKHHAFSPAAAESIVRGLAQELVNNAHDPAQLQRIWQEGLESAERAMPEVAIHAAQRLVQLGGEGAQARTWLMPAWDRLSGTAQPALPDALALKLVRTLEATLGDVDDRWLAAIEKASQANPRDARLQYLAAMACLRRELWGKAQHLLSQSAQQLTDPALRASAWRYLAKLAERRGDSDAASEAWKRAALAHE